MEEIIDPEADVVVILARGAAGFGFRIVGGTEEGSQVAVGHIVPGNYFSFYFNYIFTFVITIFL